MKGTALALESSWDAGLTKSLVVQHKLRNPEERKSKQGKPGWEGLREEAMQDGE